MSSKYDLAIVGGGLAGSSLALALAKDGARVVILEREPEFRDRVRGEGMLPWGGVEAGELGIREPLLERCAIETRWWRGPDENRDLVETTPSRLGCLNFYHPEMQQALLDLAVQAGVELKHPAEVVRTVPGDRPGIVFRDRGTEQNLNATLVVGADGRNSRLRASARFTVQRDPDCLTAVGVLYRGLGLPEDAVQFVVNPEVQRLSIIFPVGGGRYRAYIVFRHETRPPLTGGKDLDAFVELSVATGTPAAWFANAEAIGPLASFNAPDTWVNRPYRDGVVLVVRPLRAIPALDAAYR